MTITWQSDLNLPNHQIKITTKCTTHTVSNEMEHFRYKGGCGIHMSRHLKEELAWATDNETLFKQLNN